MTAISSSAIPTQRSAGGSGELDGSIVKVEGAAIALVPTVNRVPFVIIRSVSDKADTAAPTEFGAFLSRAASNSYTACVGILRCLARTVDG